MPATLSKIINAGIVTLGLLPLFTQAIEVSIASGQNSPDDIDGTAQTIALDEDKLFSLGFAWNDGPNGQGQLLFSGATHEFTTEAGTNAEVDIYHAHFNGIAHFRQQKYVTTVSLGLGASYFDVVDVADEWYPSMSIALGTRYRMSQDFTLFTDLRSTITLTDDDEDVFCMSADNCIGQFEGTLFIENSINIGVAYRF